ncbi:hypothetical protein BH23ACT2_BH23ACT2_00250 [soil metagenome]
MRRPAGELTRDLEQFAVAALEERVGPVSLASGADSSDDVVVEVDGQQLAIALKTMAYATVDRIEALRRAGTGRNDDDRMVLIVADRINAPARELIESSGWGHLDTSTGNLFLRAPGVRVETTVAALERGSSGDRSGVVGRSGRVLAYEILRRHYDGSPDPILTSTSKDEVDLARSSASDAMRALVAADLVTRDGAPALPDLFWELARVWQPADRRWLATVPDPDDWNLEADPDAAASHLAGTEAAIVHGAPAVGAGDGPVELYVPGPVLLSIAVRRYGVADPISAAASVAVPSAHQVTRPRHDQAERHHRGWPVVHPVAAALDLAALGDARSQQILDEWHPKGEAVWHEQ